MRSKKLSRYPVAKARAGWFPWHCVRQFPGEGRKVGTSIESLQLVATPQRFDLIADGLGGRGLEHLAVEVV